MKFIPTLALVLIILGALNWGLVGLGALMGNQNWNVVALLFNNWPQAVNVVYIAIGVSGAWVLFDWYTKTSKKKK
jgi:uncharacterized protein